MKGYDNYKLATPEHYDKDIPVCEECGLDLDNEDECRNEDCELFTEDEHRPEDE